MNDGLTKGCYCIPTPFMRGYQECSQPLIEFSKIISASHGLTVIIRVYIHYMQFNPWIWRENQRGVLIGFSYSEIISLNKNIVKCLKLNAIFRQSIYFFQFFLLCSITDNTKLHFCGLSMLSSTKCTSENSEYKQTFRAVSRYLY